MRNTSYYLARCASPLSQDIHNAFHTLVLSQLNHFPERISQHSPEKFGLDIIHSLLTSTFTEIYKGHQSNTGALQSPWPPSDALRSIVDQFDEITCDQLFAILIVLNFINRGNPLLRCGRLLQAFCRKHAFWRLDTLHEWIFYIVCDSDHRANVCLRTLAMIEATQQSGLQLTNEVIESFLGITHNDFQNVGQDLHPLIVCRRVGHGLVVEAGSGFITSCLQRDWSGEYKIGKRDEWYVDLTLNCIGRQNEWKAEGK